MSEDTHIGVMKRNTPSAKYSRLPLLRYTSLRSAKYWFYRHCDPENREKPASRRDGSLKSEKLKT
ncbi:hypothetical protein [uncultured Algoriphagus sp.]|uniref:hypothetical protein n=1 Tax=uncultured Algoriphagus sp. TaxID=417365 RepID=UPI00258421AF|nr:hypothetical protein [uncultured Algoriphagus sp.]